VIPPDHEYDDQEEARLRIIPSALANEILLDVLMRVRSFQPSVDDLSRRLSDAYAVAGAHDRRLNNPKNIACLENRSLSDPFRLADRLVESPLGRTIAHERRTRGHSGAARRRYTLTHSQTAGRSY